MPTKPLLAAESTLLPMRWVLFRYRPCIFSSPKSRFRTPRYTDHQDIIKFLSMTILPLACDFLSDLIAVCNYVAGGHVGFGTGMLCLFIHTVVKDWRKWLDFPEQVRSTLRLGYQTQGLWELRRGEVEDEALLSLLINLYGLPWAIHDNRSLAMQFFFVGLSLKGIVERLVQRDLGL